MRSTDYRLPKQLSILFICLFGIALVGLLTLGMLALKNQSTIDSYQQCAAAGYPIQESFPEKCSVPGGKSFVNN